MNRSKAARSYKRTHVESSPARILEALLRRLLRDLDDAKTAMAAKDAGKKGEMVNHALAILAELDAALDHSAAPELCQSLSSLYAFASDRLIAGSSKMDPKPLDEAAAVLATLEGAFASAMESAG
jgi:flagellar protein FliS